ncbi:ribose ABC transporter permease protein, partial [gut metagenome]
MSDRIMVVREGEVRGLISHEEANQENIMYISNRRYRVMEGNKKSISYYLQEYGALIALVVLIVGISIISPEFRTGSNFLSLLRQSSINGFIAFGMTCVILTDAIDLSVGSVLALSTALCAGMISSGMPVVLSMILALVIGTALGVLSGVLVTKGRLQAFIATLITMTIYRGLTLIFMDRKTI